MGEHYESFLHVCRWIYQDGDMPSDDEFVESIVYLANEWKRQKGDGMDILASTARDQLCEVINAIGDI